MAAAVEGPGGEPKRARVEAPPVSGGRLASSSVQDLMPMYYARLFPYETMYRWLVYGNDGKHAQADKGFFQRREFCFTLPGDIFVRYQSFRGKDDLEAAVKAKCPAKIDIGPVYNTDPQKQWGVAKDSGRQFGPVEREFVFDIDMDDYDDVLNVNLKSEGGWAACWPLMAAAVQVLDRGLREDFGFEHIMWVFSGRRGVHCWVNDSRARQMTDHQRTAVANYFSVYKGQKKGRSHLDFTSPKHPAVARSLEILEEYWTREVLPRQRILEEPATMDQVLSYIPDEDLVARLREKWARGGGGGGGNVSVQRWRQLVADVERKARSSSTPRPQQRALWRCKDEIVFGFTYPRLDVGVSKHRNHLLKAPFCVHPKTGKVCVPFDPEHALAFDPDAVPTVYSLLNELDQKRGEKSPTWRDTRMAEAVEVMERTMLGKLVQANQEALADKAREAAGKPSLEF